MKQAPAFELSLILVLGVAAQWLAWRIGLPSILLLLLFGLGAGPLLGFISPNELFGPLLFPLVSVFVAIILFEGGLSLRTSELRSAGRPFAALATIGAMLTFALSAYGASTILSFEPVLAMLFGAILVVTGPTVVLPLLQHARPAGAVGSILRWEAIVLDPVGALLAVLIFEATVNPGMHQGALDGALALLRALGIGCAAGFIAAAAILRGIRHRKIPENLQNAAILAAVLASFTGANLVQGEAGLFAVTLFGAVLANQSEIELIHVLRFKETLSSLFLAILFIMLGARLTMDEIMGIGTQHFFYVAYLVLVVRPVAVFASTVASGLSWKERVYLSFFAPRGIVAAAVCSVFALAMKDLGYASADKLVPAMFVVILTTVTVSGILARPLARFLGIAQEHPQGIVFLGTEPLTRVIAQAVKAAGFSVTLVENDWTKAASARLEGLRVHFGDILSPRVTEEIELGNFGRLLALSSNSALNALACVRFRSVFGSENVYQLPLQSAAQGKRKEIREQERGRYLFAESASYVRLNADYGPMPIAKATTFTAEFTFDEYLRVHGAATMPLFILRSPGLIEPITADMRIAPTPGQSVISLIRPSASPTGAKP